MADEIVIKDDDIVEIKRKKDDGLIEISNDERVFHLNDEPGVDTEDLFGKIAGLLRMEDIIKNVQKGVHFVVKIPEQFIEAYNRGDLKMLESQDGTNWASLYKINESGRYEFVANLPVQEESFIQGNPFQDFSANLQTMMIQKQLSALKEAIKDVAETVQRIEQGQTDDRIGLIISGRDQIIAALENKDPEARKRELEHGRQSLNDGRSQVFTTLSTRASAYEPIPGNKFKFYFKRLNTKYSPKRERDFYSVQDYFDLYMDATKTLAASYAIEGDMERAKSTIERAARDLSRIDFENVSTIRYLHPKRDNWFFEDSPNLMKDEATECIESTKKYDCFLLEVPAEKLLPEGEDDDRAKEI
ncbi:MAG: hypothetical protein IJI57_00140 [Flexilinea sp.]|nr:hypothetical protein [Flexilinea sp.]